MTASRRRWSFSLRTLFVVVGLLCLLCCWMAYQLNWIRERNLVRREIGDRWRNHIWDGHRDGSTTYIPIKPRMPGPWSLRIFGESGGHFWAIGSPETDPELKRIRDLFPEVKIVPETGPELKRIRDLYLQKEIASHPESPPATQVDRP